MAFASPISSLGRIFAPASLSAAPEYADGRAVSGVADVYAFSLIFCKFMVDKCITKSKGPGRSLLVQTAPRQSANSLSLAAADADRDSAELMHWNTKLQQRIHSLQQLSRHEPGAGSALNVSGPLDRSLFSPGAGTPRKKRKRTYLHRCRCL
jgi:hypothetical protein